MKPTEVWVIYNDTSNQIIYVTSEKHMADKKVFWYWNDPEAPQSGTIHNQDKLHVMTLEKAVQEIKENIYLYARDK